jgi:hypothetical protein
MPTIVRMPISNVLMQSDYTGAIQVGASGAQMNVILDTGSSTLAIDGQAFTPTGDSATTTTRIAQEVQYGSGSWVGAVVRTTVDIGGGATLNNVNLAVTYQESQGIFGNGQGIWGLAYAPLNSAFLMPADTWMSKYDADRIVSGKQVDLDPYFSQLEEAGLVANKFAFYTQRSIISAATADPAADPMNQGWFIIGGGEEQTDLYTGSFTQIAVLDDIWYNTNLLSVQVGNQPAIPALAPPPGSQDASNSIVDSGTSILLIDQTLFDKTMASFAAIDPSFPTLLQSSVANNSQGVDQTQLDLAAWPNLNFTLQGADGSPVTLTVTPDNYWQFDAGQQGLAIAVIIGDGGKLGGHSILGLPLFNGYYTVFDRTDAAGRGVISFAART